MRVMTGMKAMVMAWAPAVPLTTVRMLRSSLLRMPPRKASFNLSMDEPEAGWPPCCSMTFTGDFRSRRNRLAADAVVGEAFAGDLLGVVLVATVDDQRRLQQPLQRSEIRAAEGFPLGHQAQRVGIDGRLVLAFDDLQLLLGEPGLGEFAAGRVNGHRIEGPHLGAGGDQAVDQHHARRFAHVVGARLEGQPPDREGTAAEVAAVVGGNLVEQGVLLLLVARFNRLQQLGFEVDLVSDVDQRLDVFREARAAITTAGIDEVVADALVGTYAQ